tara:strand:+ start:2153 stop:2884 length:732 start_codon:yes stop_codon:yes gene_type:complete
MKYNIMVVLNSSYFNFGKVFMNSLHKKLNLSNIDTIFLVDIGLSKEHRDFFNSFEKVKIYDSELKTDFDEGGTWGIGWQTSVAAKTIMFKHILEQTDLPLVMIDGDCLFVKDFSELIDNSVDIQACKRNTSVPYLASFVVAQNNPKSIEFVDRWIKNISKKPMNVPRESPSLGETISEFGDRIKFKPVDRIKVSTHSESEFCDETYIIHLKSGSLSKNINDREQKGLNNGNFIKLITEYLSDE